ncbi:MAG TPA: hypothetical protein VN736_28880 [Candidatus Limnocylindrales bacterium]|nr:hypothetical protein [Candidatus Limnocylindrales bacterium]
MMPFSAAETVTIALAIVLLVLVSIMGYRAWKQSRISPQERERQRRTVLVQTGKISDATLADVREDLLIYSYAVRGVEYTATQDISTLKELLPVDLAAIGPVSVKYDPRNPANSIVVAEQWSGVRASKVG